MCVIFFTCKRQLNCVYGLQKWNNKKRKIARWSDDNLFQIAQNNLSTLHWPRCSRNWVRNCLRESKFISKENPHIRWFCLGADLHKPVWALVITVIILGRPKKISLSKWKMDATWLKNDTKIVSASYKKFTRSPNIFAQNVPFQ